VRADDQRIDFDQVRDLARRERPRVIIAGASAYPRTIDFAAFAEIAREVEAVFIVDMAHIAGLVAGGAHPSPVPHADMVTSTAHKTLRGPRSGFVVCREQWAKPVDKQVFPGLQGGPLMHIIAAKAVAFKEALAPGFRTYAAQIVANAQTLAAALMERGYTLVSGGTDNHLLLVSLVGSELTGKAAEEALGRAYITVNKNTVPGETRSPFVTSGIRIGTAALTTRAMKESEMRTIGNWIADVLDKVEDADRIEKIRAAVLDMCTSFPLYPGLYD
jgi:glycine hydroxymethyltransferase